MIALPLLTFRVVAEADFQTRTISGTLARFTYDALLGAEAVRSADAASAVRTEQAIVIRSWRRAQRRFLLLTTGIRLVAGVVGAMLATACAVTGHLPVSTSLLVLTVTVLALDSSGIVAESIRALSAERSSLARAAGPLNAATSPPPRTPISAAERLVLRSVTVTVGATTMLDDISLTIEPGTKLAVVGPSGAGKSTLLAVLLGWIAPSSGCIEWDGVPIDSAALRRVTAWSSGETRLWNETLARNVDFGADQQAASAETRLRLAEAVTLGPLLCRRHDERLGEDGSAISDGQAQRVRFARALGRPGAPLVVLDEPFRGLERDRRHRLMSCALTTWEQSTVVCALHDLISAMMFDQVALVDGGHIVEAGDPRRLAADPTSRFAQVISADRASALSEFRTLALDGGGP